MEGEGGWIDEVVQVALPGMLFDQKPALMVYKSWDSSFIQPKKEAAR